MRQFSILISTFFLAVFLSAGVVSDAEAKRFGGGKSFGSKPAQNQSAKRSSSAAPSKAQQQNNTRKQELAKKGGLTGMLGALMIGGLLGALFFGGAFENINFMDILLIGGLAFLLYKLFVSRRPSQPVTAEGVPVDTEFKKDNQQYRESFTEMGGASGEEENILQTGKIPKDFDAQSFLKGAENVYHLLQEAWDKKELGDLREFCTDNVFAELQDQIRERSGENRTEILSLQSELVNVVKNDNTTEATVVFKTQLKEFDNASGADPEITHVQEAWYFLRPNNRQEHVWLLDAIQQLVD